MFAPLDDNHILPIRPKDSEQLYLPFKKGQNRFTFGIQYGLEPHQSQSDEFPTYAKSARQRPRQTRKPC